MNFYTTNVTYLAASCYYGISDQTDVKKQLLYAGQGNSHSMANQVIRFSVTWYSYTTGEDKLVLIVSFCIVLGPSGRPVTCADGAFLLQIKLYLSIYLSNLSDLRQYHDLLGGGGGG